MKNKGFTLFEFLIVFGIMALIIGVSLVYLRSYKSDSLLNDSARNIMADLRLASELASTTQITHGVYFDINDSSYKVIKIAESETIVKKEDIEQGISISTTLTNSTARFNTLGAAIESGTITLTNQDGRQKIIDLRPSGYVRLQ